MSDRKYQKANTKPAACIRCSGEIASYAGESVSQLGNRYSHHAGQCVNRDEIAGKVHTVATQGSLFGWHCGRIEQDGIGGATVCNVTSDSRADYDQHMKAHGLKSITADRPIKLRKAAPAAKLAPAEIPILKTVRWTASRYDEWQAGIGNVKHTCEMRGQFWGNGPDPHSVWVMPYTQAPWEFSRKPILVYVADGTVYGDWAEAKSARRDSNRRKARAA